MGLKPPGARRRRWRRAGTAAAGAAVGLLTPLKAGARALVSNEVIKAAAVPARRQRRRLAPGGLRPIVIGAVKAAHCVAARSAAARYVVRRGMVAAALATWSLHWRLQIRSGKRLRERSTY